MGHLLESESVLKADSDSELYIEEFILEVAQPMVLLIQLLIAAYCLYCSDHMVGFWRNSKTIYQFSVAFFES